MAKPVSIEVWNPSGKYRVVSTKSMPGTRWINLLIDQDCRVEICTEKKTILSVEDIIALIGDKCDGVIGQLTEDWGETLFSALSKAGGKAFSNMAVGYNNVDVNAANKYGVAVGNTPGVLTETTAELAASLSLAAARRIGFKMNLIYFDLYQSTRLEKFPVTWKRASSMSEVLQQADVVRPLCIFVPFVRFFSLLEVILGGMLLLFCRLVFTQF
ncbi:Glycerate dehydrogenase [Linum perenne]